jgi:hypothetical protein
MSTQSKEELDPEGMPINRQLTKQRDVEPTSSGITPTSPSPLTARPAGYLVGSSGPGQPQAPAVAAESPRAVQGNSVPEYRPTALSRLPEQISARELANDRSNPDGCQAFKVQR